MVTDRAYVPGGRLGSGLARVEELVGRLLAVLGAGGAVRVDPAALQPAEVLLDLYGEDIRARAFTARDAGAEMMLRPDFTVPVTRLHMASGAEAARYVYCGPVWRRQETGSARPREYLQAGLEVFGAAGSAVEADAEVLGRVAAALGDAPVRLVTGDIGLILAAVDALETTDVRKAALRRHVWRPHRFQALLQRYGPDHAGLAPGRAGLLDATREGRAAEAIAAGGRAIGLRRPKEVADRLARLAAEAETPPLGGEAVARLEAILAVRCSCAEAGAALRRITEGADAMAPAIDRLEARIAAMAAGGLDPAAIGFEASFGRTTLEYYDGFVFGAVADARPDLPPIASGGRYDALTRALGRGAGVPAVGGMIRPEALAALRGAA